MTVPRSLTFDLPTVRLRALAWGPETGPTALCLHGFPDTAHTWRHLGPHLAGLGWHVVAPFSRGYRPSGVPTDGAYGPGALAADAVGVADALGVDGNAVVIGHDWGAVAAYIAAAARPQRFRRAVTLAVPPPAAILAVARCRRPASDVPLLAGQLLRSWYMAFNQIPHVSETALPWLVPLLWRRWSPGYDATADLPDVLAALDGRGSAALGYYRALAHRPGRRGGASDRDVRLRLPSVPTLYLHGGRDGCMTPRFVEHATPLLPAGSRAEVWPDTGHFLHLEDPAGVNARIVEFVAGP